MFGQHRQTARKERTCLLILGMSGVNRFIGVYRIISGRERKIFPGVHRLYSLMFRGLSCFIVFFIGNLTHTKDPRQTHRGSVESIPWGGGRVSTFTHRLSSGMFGSTSGLIRPEIGGEWVYPRWFTIYRLTIGLESRLHRVLLPIPGNIGLTSLICGCYPDKFNRSCIFSPMSTDSPRIPHRASTGYKRDSVNRA